MEENNNQNENTGSDLNNKNICFENHCWKKCAAMVLAAFLGAFLAVYFVTDQIMQRSFDKYHVGFDRHADNILRDFDKFQRNQMKNFKQHDFKNPFDFDKKMFRDFQDDWENDFDKNFDRELERHFQKIGKKPFEFTSIINPVKVKTDFDDKGIDIIVGLKPFQNDENKVNYNINGKKLTVFGNSEISDNNNTETVSFSQDFLLPDNADISAISKKKDGHKLVISVPFKK